MIITTHFQNFQLELPMVKMISMRMRMVATITMVAMMMVMKSDTYKELVGLSSKSAL